MYIEPLFQKQDISQRSCFQSPDTRKPTRHCSTAEGEELLLEPETLEEASALCHGRRCCTLPKPFL